MAKKIRVWDGTQWQEVAPALPYTVTYSAQASPPTGPANGQLWVDTDASVQTSFLLNSASNEITTSQTSSSTTYGDLATVGPSVTLTTGSKALVIISARVGNNNSGEETLISYAVSGSTTIAAQDKNAAGMAVPSVGGDLSVSRATLVNLTPGSNTFTAKYRRTAGTATFTNRQIIVINLGS